MKVTFYEKQRETYKTVQEVWTIEETLTKHNGRYVKFWFIRFEDGRSQSFKCKDYEIHRIEG